MIRVAPRFLVMGGMWGGGGGGRAHSSYQRKKKGFCNGIYLQEKMTLQFSCKKDMIRW